MAALEAETLLCGHGLPIFGAERVHEALTTTASLLRSIEEQTLACMNKGWSLDQTLHAVELPTDALAVAVSGNHVYVANYDEGLRIDLGRAQKAYDQLKTRSERRHNLARILLPN